MSEQTEDQESHAVTPLELFFDLVFVFALTQVTMLMADDLTWIGMLRGFAVLAVIWWAWGGYAWLTNSIQVDNYVASRLVMLLAMAAMLIVGLAAPQAFGAYSILFGVAYLVVRLLHIGLYTVATRNDAELSRAILRLTPGMVIAPLIIVAAGFVPEGPLRAVMWAIAIAIDFGSLLIAGTGGWHVDVPHFTERHGLIITIALGESVVALGVGATGESLTTGVVIAASLGVVVITAMWWLYFDVVAIVAERRLNEVDDRQRTTMARDSYTYIHLFLVFGIVLVALGLKKTLLDVGAPLKPVAAVALFGGVAIYLVAHLAFRFRNLGSLSRQRLIAAGVILVLLPAGLVLPAIVSLCGVSLVLVLLVTYEAERFKAARHAVRDSEVDVPDGQEIELI